MALKQNTGQYGIAATTAITTSTAGAPDQWTTISLGGGSVTSQDQTSPNVKEVIRVDSDGSTSTYFGWTGVDASAISCRGAFIMKTPSAFPVSSTIIGNIRSNGGGTSLGNLLINTTGRLVYISDAGGTTDTATNALSVSTEYKVLWRLRNQTGTTTDTLELEVYSATDVLVTGAGLSLSARNFGASSPGTVRFGKMTSAVTFGDIDFSYLSYETSASAFTTMLAMPGSNTPPTCTAPADVYAATGTPFSLTWATSDSDGTVADLVVTQTEGPTLALSGTGLGARTATPITPGIRKYSAVAVDNGGATSAVAVATVYTYAADGSAQAYASRLNTGAWVAVGTADFVGAVSIPANLSDYIETPATPVDAPITYDMNPVGPSQITIPITARLAPGGGAASTLKVEVLTTSSDTVAATETINLTDTFVTTTWALDSGELAAFTNRKVWAIRLTGDQT